MKRWLLIWFTLLIFIIRIPITAQESSDIVVDGAFGNTTEHQWSSDSTQFTFYNYELSEGASAELNADAPAWQSIDVATGTVSEGANIWTLQPTLTEAEQALLNPIGFMYQSPNSNLLIFAGEPAESEYLSLSLANLHTQQIVSLDILAFISPFRPSEFKVLWSENSNAAVIAFRLDLGVGALRVFHVGIPDFEDLSATTVREFDTFINDIPYSTTAAIEDRLLDISADSQHVLLIGRDSTTNVETTFYDPPPELIIWNPYTDNAEVVASEFMVDIYVRGAFSPDNSERLLLASVDGLFVYDTNTTQTQLLRNIDDPLNVNYFFSPDGEWLAVVNSDIRFVSIRDALLSGE